MERYLHAHTHIVNDQFMRYRIFYERADFRRSHPQKSPAADERAGLVGEEGVLGYAAVSR